jgi:RNA polymerase primary sigma factor
MAEEIRKKIERLLQEGKKRGFVTYDEINQIFTNDAVWSPYLEELFASLEKEQIEIVDSKEEGRKRGSLDPVTLYLKEIGSIPLLSREREVELSKEMERERIKLKRMAEKIGIPERKLSSFFNEHRDRKLSRKEFEKLKTKYEKIEFALYTARRKIIEANLRLVVTIAKRYVGYSNIPLLDLINEGNIGLIRAVDRYDYKEGYRFSTYGAWWIRQAIIRAITTESRIIRLPVSLFDAINRSIKTQEELTQKLGRSPSMEELATKMGMALNKVIEIMNAAEEPVSLETPVGEDGKTLLMEIIEDKRTPSPSDVVFLQILQDQISELLKNLPEKDKKVITMRFGLEGEVPHTLEEIGKKMSMSREGVRQIERKVLSRLRKKKVVKELREDFLS